MRNYHLIERCGDGAEQERRIWQWWDPWGRPLTLPTGEEKTPKYGFPVFLKPSFLTESTGLTIPHAQYYLLKYR